LQEFVASCELNTSVESEGPGHETESQSKGFPRLLTRLRMRGVKNL